MQAIISVPYRACFATSPLFANYHGIFFVSEPCLTTHHSDSFSEVGLVCTLSLKIRITLLYRVTYAIRSLKRESVCVLIHMVTCRGRWTLFPKFGFHVRTDDTIHLPRGYRKVYDLHHWKAWWESRASIASKSKMSRETKEMKLVWVVILVIRWGHLRDFHAWQGCAWLESPTGPKRRTWASSLACPMWGTRGRGSCEA